MKVLIIGGNLFIGKRLTSLLLKKKYDITVLNRGQVEDEFADKVRRLQVDRKLLRADHPALGDQKWDVIFDNVCFNAQEAEGACEAFQGRTNRYVFVSSQSVYNLGKSISEVSFNPYSYTFMNVADNTQDYAEAKRQAETVFYNKADFAVSAVRFPIILGEDDHSKRLEFHIDHIRNKKPIYFPKIDAKISFIQSSDAASFLSFMADKDVEGPVNCCSKDSAQLKWVIQLIEKAVGVKASIVNQLSMGEDSPFGIESDWYMDNKKMETMGFKTEPVEKWLPQLVAHLSAKIT